MSNVAQDVLIPDPGTFRTAFLYVGQGEATLLVIPEGENFKFVLIDTNVDKVHLSIQVKEDHGGVVLRIKKLLDRVF